jgi:hypothetical protein
VYSAVISNATIQGGTNLTFLENIVIHHDLYNLSQDYTSEELRGRHVIDLKKLRLH